MDPDANVRERIELLSRSPMSAGDRRRLIELTSAYAGWRASGGFPASADLRAELARASGSSPIRIGR